MSLKPCKECGKDVSSSADSCPHCGASLKMGLLAKTGIGAVVIVGAFLLIGATTKQYELVAQERRSICRDLAKAQGRSMQQCEERYRAEIKEGKERGYK